MVMIMRELFTSGGIKIFRSNNAATHFMRLDPIPNLGELRVPPVLHLQSELQVRSQFILNAVQAEGPN